MKMLDSRQLWERYRQHLWTSSRLGMSLDISRMNFDDDIWSRMAPATDRAFDAMARLEAGDIANPDEGRMVGHYWLRAPALAPSRQITDQIRDAVAAVKRFADEVHGKRIAPPSAARFTDLLLIGIGGSALGPQLLADALGSRRDKLKVHFLDNTDPDGIERTLEGLGGRLKSTLVLVVSKSGGTAETRNGMIQTQAAFRKRDLDFARQAVAITGVDSKLDQQAKSEGWLARFPMWDWVGGRTSVTSAVGLAPLALQGVDIDAFLQGAADMDELTRKTQVRQNPAATLAVMWHYATGGRGEKDMVILPYKDRLVLLSRYLQQLVMESLGKEKDLDGNVVHQGIAVYGNKGSTDQHAYVQQLRDGMNNFFVNFIVVLRDLPRPVKDGPVAVEDDPTPITSGDYLSGFWQGTRQALYENQRESITLTVDRLDAATLGAIVALYERTVGYYALLVNINAYHQPGVEAGKKAAAAVLALQHKVVTHMADHRDERFTAEQLAEAIGSDEIETIAHIVAHLAANKRSVRRTRGGYQFRSA